MKVKAVFWDFGGVIVRTQNPTPREELAKELGISRKELEYLVFSSESGEKAQRGEISYETHWENLQKLFNLSRDEILQLQEKFWASDSVDQQLVEYIRQLQKSTSTGLISNAFSDLHFHLNETLQIADLFNVLIISAEVGIVKPNPEIYYYALNQLNVHPSESIFIDDKLDNILAANQIGMHGIVFRNTEQTIADIDQIINSE